MASGKLTTIERVISIVYRDYGISKEISHYDAIEWIGSGLLELGIPMVLVPVVETLEVEGNRATLPCTIVELVGVRDSTSKVPLTYAGGSFHSMGTDSPNIGDNRYRYTANSNFIFTAFEEGSIDVSYKTFPVDERGYPLIPDEEKVLRALAAYIAYRMDFLEWRTGRIKDNIYMDSQQKWLFAKASASTGMKIMNMDHMEAMRAAWVRLIPQIDAHASHFTHLGVQEQRVNHSINN